FVRTHRVRLDGADWTVLNRLFDEMEIEGRDLLTRAGVSARDVTVSRVAEMRYLGQGHEVEAAVPRGALSAESLAAVTSSFEGAYRALYHRLPQGVPIEALNWRVTVAGPPATLAMTPTHSRERNSDRGIKTTRKGWFAEAAAFVDTPVYDRYALGPGVEFV